MNRLGPEGQNPYIGAFSTWQDTFGEAVSLEQIVATASTLPRDTALAGISALGLLLENRRQVPGRNLLEDQIAIVREICGRFIAPDIERRFRQGKFHVFAHEEQLLLAAKLLLNHGLEGTGEIPEGALGRLLLYVNDLLAMDDRSLEATGQFSLAVILRRVGAFPREQARYLVARYFDLLVTRAQARNLTLLGRTFDEIMRERTGVGIESYIGFAILYLAPFATATSAFQLLATGFPNCVQPYESQIPNALRARLRGAFAADRDAYVQQLGLDDNVGFASYLPFRRRPVYVPAQGGPFPLSVPFLLDKVSIGPYHELLRFASVNGGDAGVQTLNGYIGELFQSYLTDLVSSMCASSPNVRVLDENEIRRLSPQQGHGQNPPFDLVILSGDSLIVTEISTASLLLMTVEGGDPAGYERNVRRYFKPKIVDQLLSGVEAIDEGTWLSSLDVSGVRRVYPVLSLLHPFPQTEAVWTELYRICGLPGPGNRSFSRRLSKASARDLQMLSSEEYEMLEPLMVNGDSLPELLDEKLADATGAWLSMKDFLLRIRAATEEPNERMLRLFETAFAGARQALLAELGI